MEGFWAIIIIASIAEGFVIRLNGYNGDWKYYLLVFGEFLALTTVTLLAFLIKKGNGIIRTVFVIILLIIALTSYYTVFKHLSLSGVSAFSAEAVKSNQRSVAIGELLIVAICFIFGRFSIDFGLLNKLFEGNEG